MPGPNLKPGYAYAQLPVFHYQTFDRSNLQFTNHPVFKPPTPPPPPDPEPEESIVGDDDQDDEIIGDVVGDPEEEQVKKPDGDAGKLHVHFKSIIEIQCSWSKARNLIRRRETMQ